MTVRSVVWNSNQTTRKLSIVSQHAATTFTKNALINGHQADRRMALILHAPSVEVGGLKLMRQRFVSWPLKERQIKMDM